MAAPLPRRKQVEEDFKLVPPGVAVMPGLEDSVLISLCFRLPHLRYLALICGSNPDRAAPTVSDRLAVVMSHTLHELTALWMAGLEQIGWNTVWSLAACPSITNLGFGDCARLEDPNGSEREAVLAFARQLRDYDAAAAAAAASAPAEDGRPPAPPPPPMAELQQLLILQDAWNIRSIDDLLDLDESQQGAPQGGPTGPPHGGHGSSHVSAGPQPPHGQQAPPPGLAPQAHGHGNHH